MTQTAKYFYATGDSANGIIAQNAKIEQFDSRAAAEAYLATLYVPGLADGEGLAFETGDFEGCWVVRHDRKEVEALDYAEGPFERDDLTIWPPGQHLGGKAWWVTPSPEVLIAMVTNWCED